MGQFFDEIPQFLMEWIPKQHMFWVASAPLSPDGHVNISPKAIEGTFHVVNSRRVWYEDLSGTGAETVAHIRENGRITILLHAFEGPARIARLYGKGFFHEIGSPEYEALLPPEKRIPGSRAIIGLDVYKVGSTCGYAVPYYKFIGHRTQLIDWAAKKEDVDVRDKIAASSESSDTARALSSVGEGKAINSNGMKHWWQLHNLTSLDGLPAFSVDLGRGFPFAVSLKLGHRNMSSNHSNHNRRPLATPSSTTFQQIDVKVDSPFGNLEARRYPNLTSNISTFVLFLLTLIIGAGLDRLCIHYFYEYQRLATSRSLTFHV